MGYPYRFIRKVKGLRVGVCKHRGTALFLGGLLCGGFSALQSLKLIAFPFVHSKKLLFGQFEAFVRV